MAIAGLRDTTNFVTDQRPKNWREGVLLTYPNGKAPLFALTNLLKERTVDDPEFNWWEKTKQNQRFQLNGAFTAADTTLTVVTGKGTILKEGDVLWIKHTDEVVRVTADQTSQTSISVQRGFSGSTATAITSSTSGVDYYIYKIGSANPEGSLPPTGIQYDPSKVYNYTQIFRDTLEITRTASKTRLRTGDQVKEAKRECLEIHSDGIERALWFGKRSETTIDGKPARTMGGVTSFIDSGNIVTATTSTNGCDLEELEGYLKNAFTYGSQEKMAFLGNTALLTINQIARMNSQFHISVGIKEYGMNVSRLICPFGELVMKTHPLFNEMPGGTNTTAFYGVDSWMYILDMTNITFVKFNGGDTQYQPKLEANGMDGMQSGYLSEISLEVGMPLTHYLIKNLANPAADY